MTQPTKVYRKFQSFIELRTQRGSSDALARIRALQPILTKVLDRERAAVVQEACRELLDPGHQPVGGARFELHPNTIEEIDRLTDDELPRYLHYRYRYEAYPERKRLDGFPPCLQVEPSSVCNYRCVFCYQTDAEFTRKGNGHMGMMPLDLFKRILDEAQGKLEALSLASRGEPLICPDIEGMLEYAAGKFLALKLNTNAWFLDERKAHAILQAEPQTVVFSADAAEEPSYSQLRVGGRLDRVLENVRRFRDIRARSYPRSRTITRVSGVRFPGSSEIDAMDSLWGECADQVAFVDYNPWENTYERPLNGMSTPCSDLWRRMFVWWDGRVNPCDVDYRSALCVGTVSERLSSLWRSPAYEEMRQRHLRRQRSELSPCNRCTVV